MFTGDTTQLLLNMEVQRFKIVNILQHCSNNLSGN